jgi:hypothetical protein
MHNAVTLVAANVLLLLFVLSSTAAELNDDFISASLA